MSHALREITTMHHRVVKTPTIPTELIARLNTFRASCKAFLAQFKSYDPHSGDGAFIAPCAARTSKIAC